MSKNIEYFFGQSSIYVLKHIIEIHSVCIRTVTRDFMCQKTLNISLDYIFIWIITILKHIIEIHSVCIRTVTCDFEYNLYAKRL